MSKKQSIQQDLKKRLELHNTSRMTHNSILKETPSTDSRPSIPLTGIGGSVFSFKKHLKLYQDNNSFSLPNSPREEDLQVIGEDRRDSKSLPQSPTEEENILQPQRSFEENLIDVNNITQKNHTQILNLEIFSQDEKSIQAFKQFTIESLVAEQFEYYERYQRYMNEKNEERKKQMEDVLFEKFINPKSGSSVLFSQKSTQRILKYYEKRNPMALQICYVNAYQQLERCYENYKKKGSFLYKKKVGVLPTNFDELVESKKGFKLFSNFVSANFGTNFIQCFTDLMEHKDSKKEAADHIIQLYCKKEAVKSCIYNPEVRTKIVNEKGKIQDGWYDTLYNHLYKILSHEYCPRFINSNIWRDYITVNFIKEETLKFNDLYTIKSVDRRRSFFSEKYEILSVANLLTSDIFKAKRIMSTKSTIEVQSIKLLDSQLKHDNVIQLIELFKEDAEVYDTQTLSIVTTHFGDSLDEYIEKLKNPLTDLELVDFMRQILLALQCFHKQKRYFEIGQLKETNIYLSSLMNTLYIDPGFFYNNETDEEDDWLYGYLKSPEKVSSPKSDIYSAGFIFFRLASGHSSLEIQEICEKKEKKKGWLKNFAEYISSPASTSEFDSVDEFENGFSTDPRGIDSFSIQKGVTPDYIINMKEEFLFLKDRYDVRILNVMIQMIDENPYRRPKIDDILKELTFIYREIRRGTVRKMSNKFGSLTEFQKIVLSDDLYRQYFKEFLRTEFASETLLFFEDVKQFQNLTTDQQRLLKANEICQSYLKITSNLEINVSGSLKKNVSQDLKEAFETGKIGMDIFDDMAKHVSDTILLDSFNRFEQSSIRNELKEKLTFDRKSKMSSKSTVKIVLK